MNIKKTGILLISLVAMACSVSVPKIYNDIQYNEGCIDPIKGFNYKLCDTIHLNLDNDYIEIPKGFETDLASIPRSLWSIFPPQKSEFITPSIIHDYFYRCDKSHTRYEADSVFYNTLRHEGVSLTTSYTMFLAVRLFGASSYERLSCAIKNVS
jgi:hypothetical protein